jgi:hypothetical protein
MPFVAETTMYVMVVVGDAPRCEPWTIIPDASAPDKGTMTTRWVVDGVTHGLTIDYVRDVVKLHMETYAHRVAEDARETGECGLESAAGWNGVELVVGSARWFTTAHACEAAIDAKRPVAMDFESCDDEFFTHDDLRLPELSDGVRASSLGRFRRVLREGGEMHVIDEAEDGRLSCKAIELPGGSARDGELDGSMVWTEPDDDGRTARISTSLRVFDRPYRFPTYVNPGYGVTNAQAFVARGVDYGDSGYALGCGDVDEIWGYDDVVRIDGNLHYFDRPTCERAIRSELARRQWFPREPGFEDRDKQGIALHDVLRVARSFGPGVGGC